VEKLLPEVQPINRPKSNLLGSENTTTCFSLAILRLRVRFSSQCIRPSSKEHWLAARGKNNDKRAELIPGERKDE
jgi:hypothetical protein